MKDQVEALCANGISAGALNSSNDETENAALRRACMEGRLKLLYISPEKLLTEANYLLRDMHISLFAIDEAHCISQWGHDFRPEYAQMGILHQQFPHVPIIALTATADKITREDTTPIYPLPDSCPPALTPISASRMYCSLPADCPKPLKRLILSARW